MFERFDNLRAGNAREEALVIAVQNIQVAKDRRADSVASEFFFTDQSNARFGKKRVDLVPSRRECPFSDCTELLTIYCAQWLQTPVGGSHRDRRA